MSLLQKSSSIESDRKTQEFFASETSHGLGRTVRIEASIQDRYVDPLAHWVVSEHQFTNSGGADTRKQAWFAGIKIQNLRVKTMSGSMLGNEIREYRAGYQYFKEMTSTEERNKSFDAVAEGAQIAVLAFNANDVYNTEYAHKLEDHIFALREYLPVHFHSGYILEYDLPSEVNQLYTGTTLPAKAGVKDLNTRIVTDLVQLKPEIEEEMNRLLNANQLFIDYPEMLIQQNDLKASSGQQAFDLVGVNGRVKAINTFAVQTADRTGADGKGLFETWMGAENGSNARVMSSYRFRLADRYMNYKPIVVNVQNDGTTYYEISAEQTKELEKSLDIHTRFTGNGVLTPAVLRNARFSVGVKVAKAQQDFEETISSAIDRQRNNVRVELNFSTAPTVGQIYTIVRLDKRIQLLPGGQVQNVAL